MLLLRVGGQLPALRRIQPLLSSDPSLYRAVLGSVNFISSSCGYGLTHLHVHCGLAEDGPRGWGDAQRLFDDGISIGHGLQGSRGQGGAVLGDDLQGTGCAGDGSTGTLGVQSITIFAEASSCEQPQS